MSNSFFGLCGFWKNLSCHWDILTQLLATFNVMAFDDTLCKILENISSKLCEENGQLF
jgi:hypothetical protein